jgi:TPR repeat protein
MADSMHKETEFSIAKYAREFLKKKFKEYGISYIPIEDTQLLTKIYDLFQNNIIFEPVNGEEFRYIGSYYRCVKKDFMSAEKYYQLAVEHGDAYAMNSLAVYFDDIKEDHVNAKKYYFMATGSAKASSLPLAGQG